MVPDRRFGSEPRVEVNHHQLHGPSIQIHRNVHSGMVRWTSPNPSEMGRSSVGCPVGPSEDSYNALAFAVWYLYLNKIAELTSSNTLFITLQVVISDILESMIFLLWFVLWSTRMVNSSFTISYIHEMPSFPNIRHQKLRTVHWRPFLRWGNEDIIRYSSWKGHHYMIYKSLP